MQPGSAKLEAGTFEGDRRALLVRQVLRQQAHWQSRWWCHPSLGALSTGTGVAIAQPRHSVTPSKKYCLDW
jgi:hypothetical protein